MKDETYEEIQIIGSLLLLKGIGWVPVDLDFLKDVESRRISDSMMYELYLDFKDTVLEYNSRMLGNHKYTKKLYELAVYFQDQDLINVLECDTLKLTKGQNGAGSR